MRTTSGNSNQKRHVLSCLVMSNSLQPHGLYSTRSSVHGIFQARILERAATSSSRGSSWPRDWTWVFCTSCTAVGFFTHWAIEETPIREMRQSPRHKSRYKYSQVVWWYRGAFGNESAILKYLKGWLVSQNLGLLYEVPMNWTNLWETYSRSWEPKMTLHLSDRSGYNRGRVVSLPWHCQDAKYQRAGGQSPWPERSKYWAQVHELQSVPKCAVPHSCLKPLVTCAPNTAVAILKDTGFNHPLCKIIHAFSHCLKGTMLGQY